MLMLNKQLCTIVSYPILLILALATAALPSANAQEAAGIAKQYRTDHTQRILSDFVELLEMPNVASNTDNMRVNARWIQAYIGKRGFQSSVIEAGGAPYIIAERKGSENAPTVLIYAHFDGQPVIEEDWASPPFTPTLWTDIPSSNDARPLPFAQDKYNPEWRLLARSAGDDKAPVIALMAAIDALVEAKAMPDISIKLFLDGEEEIGSPTLAGVLDKVADQLSADLMLFCDGPMHQSRRRQLVLGVRGSMTVDLTTYGPNRPLHSGHYGNWAKNPNEIMMGILRSFKDENGRVTIEGFADSATPITELEQTAINSMPNIDAGLAAELGLSGSENNGERVEEAVMRPAIVIKGLYGGGVESKSRNIIEPTAQASLNIRLVPGQNPTQIAQSIKSHITKLGFTVSEHAPSNDVKRDTFVKMELRGGGYRAFRTAVSEPMVKKLVNILDKLPGESTLITPTMGGSLPIYLFEDNLDMPIIILPVANHDNNQHGRNENIRLQNLFDAIELYAEILQGFSN